MTVDLTPIAAFNSRFAAALASADDLRAGQHAWAISLAAVGSAASALTRWRRACPCPRRVLLKSADAGSARAATLRRHGSTAINLHLARKPAASLATDGRRLPRPPTPVYRFSSNTKVGAEPRSDSTHLERQQEPATARRRRPLSSNGPRLGAGNWSGPRTRRDRNPCGPRRFRIGFQFAS